MKYFAPANNAHPRPCQGTAQERAVNPVEGCSALGIGNLATEQELSPVLSSGARKEP